MKCGAVDVARSFLRDMTIFVILYTAKIKETRRVSRLRFKVIF